MDFERIRRHLFLTSSHSYHTELHMTQLFNSFLPSYFSDPIRLGEYSYNTSWYRHISNAYWASSYVDSHYWTMDASKRRFDSGSIGTTSFGFHWYCRWYPRIFWFLQSKRLRFYFILLFFFLPLLTKRFKLF